jgi:hypothetical protein
MSSKVTAIHLDALTTVSSINVSTLTDHGTGGAVNYVQTSGTTADAISGTKLAAVKLTSLPYYSNGSLSITMADETSTLDIAALASVDADGDEDPLNLTVENAAALNFSKITEGNISAKNVVDVTGGSDHDGAVNLANVVNAVLPNLTGALTFTGDNGSTLETFHAIGGLATRGATHASGADKTHSSISLSSQSGLLSAIIDGDLDAVTIDGNSDLNSITYTANAGALKISNNSDITEITLGGKAVSIDVNTNSDLETLDIDTKLNTAKISGAAAGATAGTLSVKTNVNLTTLHSAFDPVKTLTVQDNDDLAVVDFTGTATVGGATAKATVNISGNDLTANTVVDAYEATATATDAGTISDESGISTLATYLTAAVAVPSSTGVLVKLDKIEDLTVKGETSDDDVEYSDITSASAAAQAAYLTVVYVTPNTAEPTVEGVDAVAGKYAWELDPGAAVTISHYNPSSQVTTTLLTSAGINSNPALAIADLINDDTTAAADAIGVTLAASVAGSSEVTITFAGTKDSTTTEGSVAASTSSASSAAATHMLGIKIGGLSATATGTAVTNDADGSKMATQIKAIWDAKATATNTLYSVSRTDNVLTISANQAAGSRGDGALVEILQGAGTSSPATMPVVAYKIGYLLSTADNKTTSTNIILTATSNGTGLDNDSLQASGISVTSAGSVELTNTATYTTAPATDVMPTQAFADVANAKDGVTEVPGTSNAQTTNNMSWVSGS